MRTIKRILAAILLLSAVACQKDAFKEKTDILLTRCLMPTELKASVSAVTGNKVTFKWNVSSEAQSYDLRVYTDADMKTEHLAKTLAPEQVPFEVVLDADKTYYYKVQALSEIIQPSKWAVYSDNSGKAKSIKTFAVKDNLFMKVAARESTAMSFKWSSEAADFKDVDRIVYGAPGAEEKDLKTYVLQDADKDGASATVNGLTPSTEYVFTLYYLTATRGEVAAWTTPDPAGLTEVTTAAALAQGIKDGASMLLKMEGSPYILCSDGKGFDASKGFKLMGETAADGSHPVVIGSINITDTFDGGDIIFEGVTLNGNNVEGFALQHKEGCTVNDVPVGKVSYKNCDITAFTKGLLYEWGKTLSIGEFSYESCHIYAINADGSNGGDGFDLRQATSIGKLIFKDNTIYNGFRTFLRIDATPVIGDIVFNNNLLMNLSFVENTNNAGLFGFQTAPSSLEMKKNLIMNMQGSSTMVSANAKYKAITDLGLSAAQNYFYNLSETFFNDHASMAGLGGTLLDSDPCYNAKGGLFNFTNQVLKENGIGPSEWWTAYSKEPEDLTLKTLESAHTWNLADPKLFVGTAKEPIVRDGLMIMASQENPIAFTDGNIVFASASPCNKKGAPQDAYLRFKVNAPGSLVLKPVEGSGDAHLTVATCAVVEGSDNPATVSVKGGVSPMSCTSGTQKIVISDITEETMVVVYASGALKLASIAWSSDVSPVNTALKAPEPKSEPASVNAGEETAVKISWDAVDNAGSYSVVFNGKSTEVVEPQIEGKFSYTIEAKVVKMLEAGSHMVKVYTNPADGDIYNTMSEAGCASFAVLPKGGGGDTEFIVTSVADLQNAIAAGKKAITLAWAATPYAVGAMTLTAPLHLKGQLKDGSRTPLTASFTLSGDVKGSVIFDNLDFVGDGTSVIIEDKVTAPIADTVAVINSHLSGTKALYDNSGKAVSNVQTLLFENNVIENCSAGADFIDLRAGATHKFIFRRNTVANSCRTFVRTDAGHEMNSAIVLNNTFYKVATNSESKDNNGILHIRSAAGAGLSEYKLMSNVFYSILIDTDPANANGFPKLVSKTGIKPATIVNNHFYNCEERAEKSAYSFWSFITKAEGINGGGSIVAGDPFKNAAGGDYTLTNAVLMNAGAGDPRWNPMGGGSSSSEIEVKNADEFLTAISAGKTTITIAAGSEIDLTAVTENPDVTAGVLSINKPLNIIGSSDSKISGGFVFKDGATKFSMKNVAMSGKASIGNAFEMDASAVMSSFAVSSCKVTGFNNRLFSMSGTSTLTALDFSGCEFGPEGTAKFTSGDFVDIRKGSVQALKFYGNLVHDCVRTLFRIDAAVDIHSIVVACNTLYNLCSVDSKDNNGLFHVRATSMTKENFIVKNNLFANMVQPVGTPANANGYSKIVSTNTASLIPTFEHNFFWKIECQEGTYNFWCRTTKEDATAGNGVMMNSTEEIFVNAAGGDFTLTSALVGTEHVGAPWLNPFKNRPSEQYFAVSNTAELFDAVSAGKTALSLSAGEFDLFTVADNPDVVSGVWSVKNGVTLKGSEKNGVKTLIRGGFKLLAADGKNFCLEGLSVDSKSGDASSSVSNMIEVDATAVLGNLRLSKCDFSNFANRLISVAGTSTMNFCEIYGIKASSFGTGGDFIDFRKGTVNGISVSNSTFCNGIRTFLRVDAAVVCKSVSVVNNTFYNIGSVDSKDNNGIMHVRSTTATGDVRQIVVTRNIFAAMHKASETPANANGYPKLVSTASAAIAVPTIGDNIFYDIEQTGSYSWWNTLTDPQKAAAGTVLTETPFSADPTTGKFTVLPAYKGYGDLRW